MSGATEDNAVSNFRKYLRIKTVQPNPDYGDAVFFLQELAHEIGLTSKVIQVAPKKPVVVITWLGEATTLKSIMLNSHMDVVPVYPEHWKYDPFGAEKDEEGNIYGRGAQDMKCVGIQYLETIRRIKKRNQKLMRTIHVTFVPDEEIGGALGMNLFVKTPDFKMLNVGFCLDEGIAASVPYCFVFYGERAKWWLKVKCPGSVGHGSRLIENTAAEKFENVIRKFLDYREEQFAKLKSDGSLFIGDVITVNLTMVSGGVQVNCIPAELEANFDIRVPPTFDQKSLKAMFENMAKQASVDVHLEWCEFYECTEMTNVSDGEWWKAFNSALEKAGVEHVEKIFPGGTDARFLRKLGIPALGFSPMPSVPTLLHEHDEYLNENVFLRGIEIYEKIIESVSSVPA